MLLSQASLTSSSINYDIWMLSQACLNLIRSLPSGQQRATRLVTCQVLISFSKMGFRLPAIKSAKQKLQRSLSRGSNSPDVQKGYLAVYVGESQMKRVAIPISYLNHPDFQSLLSQSEEEFGFNHPMGGLTIPCNEDIFMDMISRLNGSS
ncbi:hypothetical protein ACFE04_023055 [Oxalis oulophora]